MPSRETSCRRSASGSAAAAIGRRLGAAVLYDAPPVSAAAITRRLNVILVLAIVDGLLLIPLLAHRFGDLDIPVFPIGLTHGLLFIALVLLTAKGALEGLWGWWFPAVTVVTGGPPGSIVGDIIIRRRREAA
jgi:hypothetical protein